MADTVIRSRIDAAVKLEAQSLLQSLGLTMSDAIRLFLHQVIVEKGLPFQIKLPKEAARDHDRWFRQQVQAALDEANNPDTAFVPQSKVRTEWEAKRKELEKHKSGRRKAA